MGVEYDDDAVARIIAVTRGYPYFLQQWGYEVWNLARSSPIRLEDVERATEAAIAALDESFFRVRFDRCTPSEKRYMRALADLGEGAKRSGDVADRLGLKVTEHRPYPLQVDHKGNDLQSTARRNCIHGTPVRRIHAPNNAGRRLEALNRVDLVLRPLCAGAAGCAAVTPPVLDTTYNWNMFTVVRELRAVVESSQSRSRGATPAPRCISSLHPP